MGSNSQPVQADYTLPGQHKMAERQHKQVAGEDSGISRLAGVGTQNQSLIVSKCLVYVPQIRERKRIPVQCSLRQWITLLILLLLALSASFL